MIPRSRSWQITVGSLLYTTNTYILMVVAGGQMGIAIAYSIAPLVLTSFIKVIDTILSSSRNIKYQISNIKYAIIAGLVLAAQIMFDPRIAYLTIGGVVLYCVLQLVWQKATRNNPFSLFIFTVIPFGVALLLNAYWLLPIVVTNSNPVPEGFFTTESLQFFSFADFSHALGLLHPNWPENIFGKTYFLQPEFLLLPLIVFSSLLFISKIKNQRSKIQIKSQKFNNLIMKQFNNETILFFALLGLIGVFLAKGANPPFGEVNIWLYEHTPFMQLFRDPTKFYLLVSLSYSILIPFSLVEISEKVLSVKYKVLIPAALFIFLLFLIRPAILGQFGGTFAKHEVPKEYVELKNFLASQPEFFRTLWIPKQQRFTYASNTHPSIEAAPLFSKGNPYAPFIATNSAELISFLKNSKTQKYLSSIAVKYVVVPYDSLGEFFLEDRKYNEKERITLEKSLDTIGWLKKQKEGRITLYEVPSYEDRFILRNTGKLSYRIISPSLYAISVSTIDKNNLIFSENFNPYWVAKINGDKISSVKTKEGLNSFSVPSGEYTLEVYYFPEQYYSYGRVISLVTLCIAIMTIFMLKSKNYAV